MSDRKTKIICTSLLCMKVQYRYTVPWKKFQIQWFWSYFAFNTLIVFCCDCKKQINIISEWSKTEALFARNLALFLQHKVFLDKTVAFLWLSLQISWSSVRFDGNHQWKIFFSVLGYSLDLLGCYIILICFPLNYFIIALVICLW